MPLSIDNMENDLPDTFPGNMKAVTGILVASVNDWPNEVSSVEDYLIELEVFIQTTATKATLEAALAAIDLKKDIWKAESIAGLLDLYLHYDAQIPVRDILEDVKSKIGL